MVINIFNFLSTVWRTKILFQLTDFTSFCTAIDVLIGCFVFFTFQKTWMPICSPFVQSQSATINRSIILYGEGNLDRFCRSIFKTKPVHVWNLFVFSCNCPSSFWFCDAPLFTHIPDATVRYRVLLHLRESVADLQSLLEVPQNNHFGFPPLGLYFLTASSVVLKICS